ncbi:MAG: peptidase M16 [Acidobacteria bacterium]|jgi:zinc protease|nr:peptidase M16 [Acidobacteriota bacterium]MDP7338694.1 pitrilysin family protein [Vicinamibacterales bacterium]MDP7691644.1 pitrilysin family protein [Vicinamibacterales bacterium]HJN46356.1 pitrilysin family protein [Vicinamibacterales bacterium]
MLDYTKQTLDNGLDVVVHEDHRCPIVAVNLWYHVGSKNEQPGRTGLAHLFEHLMFEGSAHHDSGYFSPLQQAGAAINGSTSCDRTNYWEVVPASALDLALWLESDRMGYLLPALTGTKFENQRDVVLNERRQQYENRPYGMALMALMAALFPPSHPYHWTTIGETVDLEAATLEEAHAFFRTFYHPGNASLTLAGDVETGPALARVRHHFDEIPAGPPIPPVVVGAERVTPVTLASGTPDGIRLVLEDRVELPRIYLAWRTPRLFAQGDAGMDILAEMLTGGKTSRLYRTLVHERRIATDVSAAQGSRELAGWFCITATAAPGHEVDELEQVIGEALADLATAGPDAREIERCRTQVEAQFVYSLQSVGGFHGRSDQLNAYNVYTGDPGFMAQDRARYRETTADQLRELAATQLTASGRVALSVVPHGAADRALPGSTVAGVS